MDGWSDFNAIPVWAGMLGLLATLVRLTVRERVVRRGIDIKTPLESESQGVGYVAPMPKDFNARFPEWHYDYDFSLNRPSSLIRWMFRVLALFLSGRKRAPQPDAELQSLSRELRPSDIATEKPRPVATKATKNVKAVGTATALQGPRRLPTRVRSIPPRGASRIP